MADHPRSRTASRPRPGGGIRAYGAALAAAALLAVLVASASRGGSTVSSVVVSVQPFAVESLFDPPGAERDLESDATGQEALAVSTSVTAAAALQAGTAVAVSAASDPEQEQVTISVDGGSARASMAGAQAAADTYLQLRVENGIAQSDGGIAAITANLEQLAARRAEITDREQLAAIDITIRDQEASLAQLEAARARFDDEALGAVETAPSDPSADQAWILQAVTVFAAALLLFGGSTWVIRRWCGPVRASRPARGLGLPLSGVLLDDEGAAAYVVELRLAAGGRRGAALIVTSPPGSAPADTLGFTRHLAALVARTGTAAAVDGRLVAAGPQVDGDAGATTGEASLAHLRMHPGSLPDLAQGEALILGAGAHPDPAGAIATPQTAALLHTLGERADLVAVAAPDASHLAAVAWSGHGDALVLLAIDGVTQRTQLRRARRVLASFGVRPGLLVVAPSLVADPSAERETALV